VSNELPETNYAALPSDCLAPINKKNRLDSDRIEKKAILGDSI